MITPSGRTWMGMQPNNWRVSPTVLMLLCTSFMKLSSAVSVEPIEKLVPAVGVQWAGGQ